MERVEEKPEEVAYTMPMEPQISLNVLYGTPEYQTIRLKGVQGKNVVHILIDTKGIHNCFWCEMQ